MYKKITIAALAVLIPVIAISLYNINTGTKEIPIQKESELEQTEPLENGEVDGPASYAGRR